MPIPRCRCAKSSVFSCDSCLVTVHLLTAQQVGQTHQNASVTQGNCCTKKHYKERQMATHGITIKQFRLEKEIIKEAKSPELQELGVVYCFKGFRFMQDYICFSTENTVRLFHCQFPVKLLPTQIVHRAYMPRSQLKPRS